MPPLDSVFAIAVALAIMLLYFVVRGLMLAIDNSRKNQFSFALSFMAMMLFWPLFIMELQLKEWGVPFPRPGINTSLNGEFFVIPAFACVMAYLMTFLVGKISLLVSEIPSSSESSPANRMETSPQLDRSLALRWCGVMAILGGMIRVAYRFHFQVHLLDWVWRFWPLVWGWTIFQLWKSSKGRKGVSILLSALLVASGRIILLCGKVFVPSIFTSKGFSYMLISSGLEFTVMSLLGVALLRTKLVSPAIPVFCFASSISSLVNCQVFVTGIDNPPFADILSYASTVILLFALGVSLLYKSHRQVECSTPS
ncbi:MAG: hypothetical protein O2955_01690 [Planctomycetota bacterium]|nr:hypothetical protein [Planctomycetota bacterium]MDA1211196.1 hypothetical protein [Planctomycetota bacterium]